jgi:hypothetical protein
VKVAHQATKELKLRPYRFEAVQQLQQWYTAARIQYFHHWSRRFMHSR